MGFFLKKRFFEGGVGYFINIVWVRYCKIRPASLSRLVGSLISIPHAKFWAQRVSLDDPIGQSAEFVSKRGLVGSLFNLKGDARPSQDM